MVIRNRYSGVHVDDILIFSYIFQIILNLISTAWFSEFLGCHYSTFASFVPCWSTRHGF